MEGNSAIAEPNQTEQTNLSPQQGVTNESEGSQEGGAENPEVQLALIKERYKHSSEEGIRLNKQLQREVEEKQELRQRLEKLERNQQQQGSLTKQAGFPSRDQYKSYWKEKGDKTDAEADAEYDREYAQWTEIQTIKTQNAALHNLLRLEAEQREKGYMNTDPVSREAVEFFKDIPELEAIPLADKVERYKAIKNKLVVTPSGRDLSQIKNATGGNVGGLGGSINTSNNSQLDDQAKSMGFPSWKAVEEANKIQTVAEMKAFKAKYRMK